MPPASPSAHRPRALQSKAAFPSARHCGAFPALRRGGGTGNRDNGWCHPTRWHIRRRPWERGGRRRVGALALLRLGFGACRASVGTTLCSHPDRKCPSDRQEAKDPALENTISFGPAPKEEGKRWPRRRGHWPHCCSWGARVRGSGGPRGHEKQKQQPPSPPLGTCQAGVLRLAAPGPWGDATPGDWQRAPVGPGTEVGLRLPSAVAAPPQPAPCPRQSRPASGAAPRPRRCRPQPCHPAPLTARPGAQQCRHSATLGARPREHRAEEGGRRLGAATSVPAARAAQEPSAPSLCQGKSRPRRHGAEVIAGYYTALLLNTDHFSSDKRSV